jgi:hypothetical protein
MFFTINSLPDEVVMHVFVFLEPLGVLNSACTSRAFYKMVNYGDLFWRNKYCKHFAFPDATKIHASARQLQQCCKLALSRSSCHNWLAVTYRKEEDMTGLGQYSWPSSILLSKSEIKNEYSWQSERICLSSSQDRDEEVLENVLPIQQSTDDDWEKIVAGDSIGRRRDCWWSSAPSSLKGPTDTKETLLFGTRCGKAIITDVAIKALKDPSSSWIELLGGDIESSNKVYTWPRISIKIYCLPRGDNGDDASPFLITSSMAGLSDGDFCSIRSGDRVAHLPCIEHVLIGNEPVYESPIMDVSQNTGDSWQYFTMPNGCIGNVITFTLWGKDDQQFPDSGYYVCVDRVAARGVPLITETNEEIID